MPIRLRPHQETALKSMQLSHHGQIIVPTGGGKTFIMIQHAKELLQGNFKTVVVVAPRILLAQQLSHDFLEHIDNVDVLHVHSGDTHHTSTTKTDEIEEWHLGSVKNQIIFTTYHSLHKITSSPSIEVSVMYCDEAHNCCTKNFFNAVKDMTMKCDKKYFFTATPRISHKHDRGMNNHKVFGHVLESVPAPTLIENGSIIPPTIVPFTTSHQVDKKNRHMVHSDAVQDILDGLDVESASKVLVAVPSSNILRNMLVETDILPALAERGYNVLHVTSKFGAYVNKTKVNRETFFETLTTWGKDPLKKFIVFHYSILSEGINVSGLTHTILLRNLNVVEMAQTVGRVIRLHPKDAKDIATGVIPRGNLQLYRKPTGYVTVPIHRNHGKNTVKRLQRVVDEIFVKGIPATAYVG